MDRVTEETDLEAVLAKELNSLSIQDRNRVQEELHCVSSLAVEETTDLLETSLRPLWMLVRQILVNRCNNNRNTMFEHSFLHVLDMERSYLHSRESGLKFLRADLFRVESAARRMVNHIELLHKYFGPVALQRPLRYSDLNKEEQDCVRVGNQQLLPSRDRNGRLVLVVQGALLGVEDRVRLRLVLYFQSVIAEDINTQKHGLTIVFAGSADNIDYLPRENVGDWIRIWKSFPVRLAVNHQCLPGGPRYQILKGIWMILLARKAERVRTKFHDDLTNVETHYKLMSYGIPVHQIPRTSTGNIKYKNNQQWIKTRKAIDRARENSLDPATRIDCGIIAHPGNHDVLFSRGGNAAHSGNLEYQQDMIHRLDRFKSNPDRDSRHRVRDEVLDCVRARDGRFLHLVKGGWWEELSLEKIHDKITTSFYDLSRKLLDARAATKQQQWDTSETSMFLNSSKRQKVGDGGVNCGFFA